MTTSDIATISTDNRQLDHVRHSRLDDSLFSRELAPHYMKLAGQLASSDLVPKSFRGKPQDLFICWAMGYQVGLSPEQAMQCIAVINGKPAMWGDDMLALCMTHKDFVDIVEEAITNKDGTVTGYSCTVTRKGKNPKINVFNLDMAKKAGLLAKGGVWSQYPERMLKLRARGFTLRDAFPDALKGIKNREEVEDYIEADYKVTEHKGSRTEQLKQDFLTKTGKLNDDETERLVASEEDNAIPEENLEGVVSSPAHEVEKTATELHHEIKQLITETGITQERLDKALKFYDVADFDELDLEASHHFIRQLSKL